MNKRSARRWFRISLRLIFVLITVFCCVLAWQLKVVRQRQVVLKELRQKPGYSVVTAEAWVARMASVGNQGQGKATISILRRWLGDEAIQEIWHTWDFEPEPTELRRLKELFPEATITREGPPEPCHPGCFPSGTLVTTPVGTVPIEQIRAGARVTTIDPRANESTAEVQFVFVNKNRLWKVDTEAGSLVTTETQPLCLANYEVAQVGTLRPGDTIMTLRNGSIQPVRLLDVAQTSRVEMVYNVILGDSQLFVANGFLARSKPPESAALTLND